MLFDRVEAYLHILYYTDKKYNSALAFLPFRTYNKKTAPARAAQVSFAQMDRAFAP